MLRPVKPRALRPEAKILVISPASPSEAARVQKGCTEVTRLGFIPTVSPVAGYNADGFFAAPLSSRLEEFVAGLTQSQWHAVFCARGGYGSTYLLDSVELERLTSPKILLGYSDITCLQIFLWQRFRWVTFYGPMVAAGFDGGPDAAGGYDRKSFTSALVETRAPWTLDLQGGMLVAGGAEGILLGGCLTLVDATLGTPWELDTNDSILLLEDFEMKPYQVDRALMHLKQAGKFIGVRAVILGEFPKSLPFVSGGPTVQDVCQSILGPLGVPIVWGAPVGHTPRPMLTIPLGVRAHLESNGSGRLEILESAVCA